MKFGEKFMIKFGICDDCEADLEAVWFEEEEVEIKNGQLYQTGRVRKSVDYLYCPFCGKKFCVDDTFDGVWRRK